METQSKIIILLPVCFELDCDVFFNVIKNLIARSKLDDHFIDNAFKVGMSGEKFSIEAGDVTVDWLQHNSKEQKIRQAKLLGFWASANFPVLGKKFFGLKWQPPHRYGFQVDGYTEQISAEEIDAIVFKKLKIRLIELDVTQSTSQKLIRFVVDIPTDVVKSNETELSSKIKSFDVNEESADACWKALKLGSKRSQSVSDQQRQVYRNNENPTIAPKLVQAPKRMRSENSSTDQNENSSKSSTCSKSVKRQHLDSYTASNSFNGNNTSESNSDPVKTILFEIKNDVEELTDLVRAAFTARDSEPTNREDGIHVLIFNQKDDEIARLKASSQELLESNQTLTNDRLVLKEHNDRQSELINALQKGVDSTSKLQMQAERDYTMSLNTIETLKHEITKLNVENRDIKSKNEKLVFDNQVLGERLHAIETVKREMEELKAENQQLREESYGQMNVIEEIKRKMEQLKTENLETKNENEILQKELDETVKREMEELKAENRQLREESYGEMNVVKEMNRKMEQLQTENQETKNENQLLQKELDILSKETACIVAELKSSLDDLRFSSQEARSKSDVETQTERYSEVPGHIGGVESKMESNVSDRIDFVSESNVIEKQSGNDSNGNGSHLRQNDTDHKHNITVSDNNAQNCVDQSTSEPEFFTDDIIVIKCRDMLKNLKFGWMKFQPTKCSKFSAGFVHPADPDGKERAQKVTPNGYVSDEKNEFFDFAENVPGEKKNKSSKTALKKLNQNFKFSLS